MAVQSDKGNSVVAAVEEACAIYGVSCYRMQSRAFSVVGKGGRQRPMFMGQWRDRFGDLHRAGMPDLLLTPRLMFVECVPFRLPCRHTTTTLAVALWVECKAGRGELSEQQELFRDDALAIGAHYLEARNSADQVIQWFKAFDVQRR